MEKKIWRKKIWRKKILKKNLEIFLGENLFWKNNWKKYCEQKLRKGGGGQTKNNDFCWQTHTQLLLYINLSLHLTLLVDCFERACGTCACLFDLLWLFIYLFILFYSYYLVYVFSMFLGEDSRYAVMHKV